jgi:5-methylthioribose kinase
MAAAPTVAPEPDDALRAFVRERGLFDAASRLRFTPLTGGVSSDIWRVEDGASSICVKRALAKLRVAAEWRAPVERSLYEAAWLKGAAQASPGAAPRVLAEHPDGVMFAMEHLPPERFVWWKGELLAGRVDPGDAAAVGDRLGRIHAAFAGDATAPARFATDAIFHDIRLEPYLLATARAHPDLAPTLEALARRTAATKRTAAHGDVSPKNILIGPDGPVFLDAECAWWGDPAFDLAFCLNHLLLKCLVARTARAALFDGYARLREAYLAHVAWEPAADLEARAATLLPALLLARVDGKSPVEYFTAECDRNVVRRVARALLRDPQNHLAAIAQAWRRDLESGTA